MNDWTDEHDFDEGSFWQKLGDVAGRLGKGAVEKLLVAYYVAMDPVTPMWAKGSLLGALAYFGLPIDAVPDVIPAVGFGDDIAVLALALATVAASIRVRHVRMARATMRNWGMKVVDPPMGSSDDDPADGYDD